MTSERINSRDEKNIKKNVAESTTVSQNSSERLAHSFLPETAFRPHFEAINLHRGYVLIWRKIIDSSIFRDTNAFHLFVYLLVTAQYQEEKYSCMFEGQRIYLQRGQIVTGRYNLSKALNMPPSTVRNALKRLSSTHECISIKQDNKRTIITLLNWDTYQNCFKNEDNGRTTKGQQEDTNQYSNTVNKVNNISTFKAPSLEETKAYFTETLKASEDHAINFFSFYESKGWVVGRAKMKNWKMAAQRSLNWQTSAPLKIQTESRPFPKNA